MPGRGWSEKVNNKGIKNYYISTGCWPRNESIINAMEKNQMIWMFTWVQSNRGGHHIFREIVV